MKKVFVTGASGFIGFHLCLHLKRQNHFVIGLDNFNPYYDINLKNKRKKILKDNQIEVINSDINDKKTIQSILNNHKITHVVHLAAQAGVRFCFENPSVYVHSNLTGFVSLLETIKDYPDIKLVFASSSSVYGKNQTIPFSIDHKTDMPTNLYGATKKANEALAYSYHHIYKIPMIGLRYFTVYGPYGRPDMAYFKFTKNILEKKPIEIYNNGNMLRDFTYIDDIVEGTAAAIDAAKGFDIYNLGNNNPTKLLDFISIIEDKLKIKAIKDFKPIQKGEMLSTFANIERSKDVLGFSPKVSIKEGMERFIDWYLKEYCKN